MANEDSVPDAHAGRLETVPVLANDVNPFPDTPLKIVDVKMTTGAAGTQVAVAGDKVTVQAPEDFTGNVVVSYTVADKTGDKARWVDGRITLNVKGKPAVPAVPLVQEVKSKTVLLKWTTPVDNGSPLTGYTVKRSDGVTQECATNTCLITGLANAKPYTFTVSAKNAVGESAFSKASASATPDTQPDKPAPPAIVRGDTQLEVSWVTPVGEYSAVKSFNVEISPVPAGPEPAAERQGQQAHLAGTGQRHRIHLPGAGREQRAQALRLERVRAQGREAGGQAVHPGRTHHNAGGHGGQPEPGAGGLDPAQPQRRRAQELHADHVLGRRRAEIGHHHGSTTATVSLPNGTGKLHLPGGGGHGGVILGSQRPLGGPAFGQQARDSVRPRALPRPTPAPPAGR